MAIIQTVTGPLQAADVSLALAHEHGFVDFLTPAHSDYMGVDWAAVRGACLKRARELRAQGVDLFVDWTALGVGRNVLLLRDVSQASGLPIVCPTGIYLALRPPALTDADHDDLVALFIRELTQGMDGTGIRAGFIKIAVSDDGPTPEETAIHRAAADAGRLTGAAIGLHGPRVAAVRRVIDTLSAEAFPLDRLIWAHAQWSDPVEHLALAERGVVISFDNLSAPLAADGTPNDDDILNLIEKLLDAGYEDQIHISADATVWVNPPARQYGQDATYVVRTFVPKLRGRCGDETVTRLLRDNVVRTFAMPDEGAR